MQERSSALSRKRPIGPPRHLLKWDGNTIDPEKSELTQKWDVLVCIALVYTATVTPYEVRYLRRARLANETLVYCSPIQPLPRALPPPCPAAALSPRWRS